MPAYVIRLWSGSTMSTSTIPPSPSTYPSSGVAFQSSPVPNISNLLDALNKAIAKVENSIVQVNAIILQNVQEAKKLYLEWKRAAALKTMQHIHKSKVFRQCAMAARFQLIAARIELKLSIGSSSSSMRTHHCFSSKTHDLVKRTLDDLQFLQNDDSSSALKQYNTPRDAVLMRKLARLAKQAAT